MRSLLPRLLALLLLAGPALADDTTPKAKALTPAERVKKDLDYLAGEECQGRGLETDGLKKAGDYIAAQFKAAGLKPGWKDTYFQPFDVNLGGKLDTPLAFVLKNGDKTLEPKVNDGWTATTASASSKTKAAVVFAGYGLTSTENPKYDDYADFDVKGKIVVVLRRTPQADDEKGLFGKNSPLASLASKVDNAAKHGAIGVIFVSDAGTAGKDDKLIASTYIDGTNFTAGPILHVKRDVIDPLLADQKLTLAEWEKAVDKAGKPNSFELKGWEAESEVTVKSNKRPTRNVVGVLEGTGPLKDETVVIGGHYDHLGSGERGSNAKNKGMTHFGADDNASGTTGVLELARRFGTMTDRQGRRMVFICFSGEERGLLGSQHYCKDPAFPLDKTAFMLNLDMIGRMTPAAVVDKDGKPVEKDGKPVEKDRLMVYGHGTSTGLEKVVDEKAKPFDFKLTKVAGGGGGDSDHTSFYLKNVPVLFFFTGTHKDYHQPSDTPDKINVDGLLKTTEFVAAFADHYSTVKEKPDFQKTKGGSINTGSGVGVPRIQFAPGNYGEEDKGVLVAQVTEGGPADKAGLKEGDFIVGVGGVAVKGMEGYMTAMGKQKVGVEFEITVMRKDKELKLKVTGIK